MSLIQVDEEATSREFIVTQRVHRKEPPELKVNGVNNFVSLARARVSHSRYPKRFSINISTKFITHRRVKNSHQLEEAIASLGRA